MDKIIFTFCNNSRNRMKLLVRADNRFQIHFKRIERGRVVQSTEKADKKTMILRYDDKKYNIRCVGVKDTFLFITTNTE